jgi:bla regulator protein blaR1
MLLLIIGGAPFAGSMLGRTQSAQVEAAPAGAVPAFEVASIKPSGPDVSSQMMMFTPDGISIKGFPLQLILREAFHVENDHIVGAPEWVKTTHFDIDAKVAAEDAPKLKDLKFEQRGGMLVQLLEERFKLKYHHETREMQIYSLVVAKGGSRLKPTVPDPASPGAKKGSRMTLGSPGNLEAQGTGMPVLAHMLSRELGRTVVDKTGLTGDYDYSLKWKPDDAPPASAGAPGGSGQEEESASAAGPTLFTALEEQLGLKLESGKGPVDVIVIDHVEMPSAN